jgi:hypothetical protein
MKGLTRFQHGASSSKTPVHHARLPFFLRLFPEIAYSSVLAYYVVYQPNTISLPRVQGNPGLIGCSRRRSNKRVCTTSRRFESRRARFVEYRPLPLSAGLSSRRVCSTRTLHCRQTRAHLCQKHRRISYLMVFQAYLDWRSPIGWQRALCHPPGHAALGSA